jgi:hypothetical protein
MHSRKAQHCNKIQPIDNFHLLNQVAKIKKKTVLLREKISEGTLVEAGTPIGHPSCEGGSSTGTHVHVARKYNGEWIIADSAIPFIIEGWLPKQGLLPYEGTLTRFEQTITACVCADQDSNILATGNPSGFP